MLTIVNNTKIVYDYSEIIRKKIGYDESQFVAVDNSLFEAIYNEMGVTKDVTLLLILGKNNDHGPYAWCEPEPSDCFSWDIPIHHYSITIIIDKINPIDAFIHELGHILFTNWGEHEWIMMKTWTDKALRTFGSSPICFELTKEKRNCKNKITSIMVLGEEQVMEDQILRNFPELCEKYSYTPSVHGMDTFNEKLDKWEDEYVCREALAALFKKAITFEKFEDRQMIWEEICMLIWHADVNPDSLIIEKGDSACNNLKEDDNE